MSANLWRPIETAPVNEGVLVFIPKHPDWESGVYVGYWSDGEVWSTYGRLSISSCHSGTEPTFWQPLPQPPELPKAE